MCFYIIIFVAGSSKMANGLTMVLCFQQVASLRAMPGCNYADLNFRQTVVGRQAKGSAAEVLAGATHADAEQMLCYLRWLDRDCDGYISEKDLGLACVTAADTDGAAALLKKWRAADVKMDKPNLKGGARGVLDKLGGLKLGGLRNDAKVGQTPVPSERPVGLVLT